MRKQKEFEHELMTSQIKSWEGEVLRRLFVFTVSHALCVFVLFQHMSSFGEVLLVSHVIVQAEGAEKKERLFVLFSGCLVMLSIGAQLNNYTYEVSEQVHRNKLFL